jgi:hypothetical protein
MTGVKRMTVDEREVLKVKQLKIKDKNELKFKGRYERIFPLENEALLRYP